MREGPHRFLLLVLTFRERLFICSRTSPLLLLGLVLFIILALAFVQRLVGIILVSFAT